MKVGIEAIHAYGGRACIDVGELGRARGLDSARFEHLLMKRKTVSFPFEDPVSFAVNAARPLVDALSERQRRRIELLIVSTESGIDFGKAMSTYVHHHLGLERNCRTFELKQACYAGTAALQMATHFVLSNTSPGAKALVICTDVARPIPHSYAEPSQGATAVALLVGSEPEVLELEQGANGYYGYEVMDSCRPTPETETGDADLSLLTYLDCLQNTFELYRQRVGDIDFQRHFTYLAFHTPFGGLVKGAHRTMMRRYNPGPPASIEEDYQRRLEPSLRYCQEVGNAYSATVFLALCGVLEQGSFPRSERIGLFSYGSGCCSEFYSGIATERSRQVVARMGLGRQLAERETLTMAEYDRLLEANRAVLFGEANKTIERTAFREHYERCFAGRRLLVLDSISGYHRRYVWS